MCVKMLFKVLILTIGICFAIETDDPSVLSGDDWRKVGQEILKDKLEYFYKEEKPTIAKSAVLVVGSGMSFTTIRAAGIFSGVDERTDFSLSFEEFPIIGFSKTYCTNMQVGDDVCTSSSYLGGIRRSNDKVGPWSNGKDLESIAEWAIASGKDVGIVTTSRLTKPSFAGIYAHSPRVDWEVNVDPETGNRIYPDFAYQLINQNPGKHFKVILGGGRNYFTPEGKRDDKRNLIDEWIKNKQGLKTKFKYVTNKHELRNITDEEYVLGLFHDEDMDYHMLSNDYQPELQDMVEAAVKVLSKNPKGYFLFVFGGRISDAHSGNQAKLAIDETNELSKATRKIRAMTNTNDTLVVVTANHGSTMTISGYPTRWNDITGLIDNMLYYSFRAPTLTYSTGPGYNGTYNRTYEGIGAPDYTYPSSIPLEKGTHGGEDVSVFASGPSEDVFMGAYDLETLPHLIGYAACFGPGQHSCNTAGMQAPSLLLTVLSGALVAIK